MSGSDQEGSGKKRYPLPIFYESGEQKEQSSRPRGRGRPGRSYRGRSRSQHSHSNQEGSQNDGQNANKSTDPKRFARGYGRGGRGDFRPVSNDQRNVPPKNNGDGVGIETIYSRPRPPPFFTRDKLIRFSERTDVDEVLLDIGHSRSGFVELLQNKPDPKLVYHLIKLLSNVSESTQMANRREIMQVVEKAFLHNLTDLLSEVCMKEESTRMIWKSDEDLAKFLKNIIQLLTVVITTLPSSLAKCKNVIRAVSAVQDEFALDVQQELNDVEEVLQRERQAKQISKDTSSTESNPATRQRKPRDFASMQPSEPPENFRNIPIFPTLPDLRTNKPFLRANRVEGKYESLETYLDVQFRLLREDYIQPLRKGISEYRSCIKENLPVKKLRDIKLYHSVQILRPVCSQIGINYILQFDITSLRNINWAASRRLLFGSLLCLSKDNFETLLYAVVTDRNDKQLKDGYIQVHFENMTDGLDLGPYDQFVMAETSAYFEAYRYILEGLLETKDTIPFQRYIINCEDTVRPPKYLLGKVPHYDFSCLLDDPDECFPPIPVLNTLRWPSCQDLGLDHTQYEAIKRAITKELAIIQGPPGTGKTYVGLKITRLLLENSAFWGNKKQSSPILVVCYTNHALDQFLEAILDFCDGKIVRIGGRCKSEHLEPYLLRNVKKQRRDNRERSFRIMQKERDCFSQLRSCEKTIAEVSAKIKKTTTNIISYNELEEFMTDNQKYGFQLTTSGEVSPDMSKWLGFADEAESADSLSEASIPKIWEQEIIANINMIPDHEKMMIIDPWMLDLKRRAELYKSWVNEYTENVQNAIDSPSNDLNKPLLHSLVSTAQEKILDVEPLLKFITTVSSKIQIQMLFAGQPVSLHFRTRLWLKLTGRKDSLPEIINVLETMRDSNEDLKYREDEGEDLEEDRELDEDDFLFDYRTKADKQDKGMKNESDWITDWNNRNMRQKVKNIFSTTKQIDSLEAERLENILRLQETKRRELYAYWVKRYRIKLRETVALFEKQFNESTETMLEVRDMETVEILNEAKIIGMTTTGAAKYRKLFQSVRPKIIIVEEAAEVLESHIVTTLNDDCQHLILIGDHKQLRPSTAVYDLSKRYHMDVSLFERMVRNKVPYVTLEEQHRMRPEISTLMKHDDLYPQLRDHPSVLKYKSIKGIDFDVQFIDHEETEATATESTSYSNPHEAKYIASLCQYLLHQGYKPDQITVITPYMGQVFLLRREMPKTQFEGVRITAIDNYQGEESDIILLSLVRSSSVRNNHGKRNRIGFVGIENRICVSLSRAKEGLYVIGNFQLLAECSPMWADMIQGMRDKGCVKKSLTLRCQIHPDQFVHATSYKDFQKVSSGGCQKACLATLPCGHICPKNCHILDKDHLKPTCTMPCEKIVCDEGHRCTKKCWQDCGSCKTMVEKALPLCQHIVRMPCHKDVYLWKCHVQCEAILPCGHRCNKECYKCTEEGSHERKCKKMVIKDLECKHSAEMMCYEDAMEHQCKKPCVAVLDCKHKCSGKCGTCFGGRVHNRCGGTCKKTLPCGHECSFPCSEICPPCTKLCGFVCSHGVPCKKKCWETCDTCNNPCTYSCSHQKCDHDCNEECTNEACMRLCLSRLACGHPCRSLCGEICVCIICNSNNLRNGILQTFDESTCFMQIPDCECIIEVERLDRHMHDDSISRRAAICKRCPHCSKPIRKTIKRYSNVLKQTRAKIVEKFRLLIGSDKARMSRTTSLRIQLQTLKLNVAERKIMQSQLDKPNNYDTLHTTEMKIECLKDLINVTNEIQKAELYGFSFVKDMRGIVVTPKNLRKLIIDGKKFTTSQFWKEIDREICRLRLGLGFYQRKQFAMRGHVIEEPVNEMFKAAFHVLEHRDLNSKRIGTLQDMLNLPDFPEEPKLDSRVVSKLLAVLMRCYEPREASGSERGAGNDVTHNGKTMKKKVVKSDVKGHEYGSDEYFEHIENASDSADPVNVLAQKSDNNDTKLDIAAMVTPHGIGSKRTSTASSKAHVTKDWDDLLNLDLGKLALS